MKHLAKVNSGNTDEVLTERAFTYLCDAVLFCHDNSSLDDQCSVTESYESLTGREEYVTIMSWSKEKENVYT